LFEEPVAARPYLNRICSIGSYFCLLKLMIKETETRNRDCMIIVWVNGLMALVIIMAVEDRFPAIHLAGNSHAVVWQVSFFFKKSRTFVFSSKKKKQRIDTEKGYAYKLGWCPLPPSFPTFNKILIHGNLILLIYFTTGHSLYLLS